MTLFQPEWMSRLLRHHISTYSPVQMRFHIFRNSQCAASFLDDNENLPRRLSLSPICNSFYPLLLARIQDIAMPVRKSPGENDLNGMDGLPHDCGRGRLGTQTLRLPRLVDRDPRGPQLLRSLTTNTRPLWQGGKIEVPVVTCGSKLAAALRRAQSAGQVVRSLEIAQRKLATEERGLRLADRRSDVPRGARVSRLLVLADDGVERFYRHVETLLRRHGPRVLAVRLEVDAGALGELLFGPGHLVRLLLIEHKEAVCAVLLAMAEQGERPEGST